MRHFDISIDIAAPPERVWEVMSDTDRWSEWTRSVTSITRIGGGPFVVGSRAWIRQPGYPPAMWKVVAIDPGRGFTWKSGMPGLWVTANHTVDRIPSGTRVKLSLDYLGLFGAVFANMTRKRTERYLDWEARGLKARSENPAYRV